LGADYDSGEITFTTGTKVVNPSTINKSISTTCGYGVYILIITPSNSATISNCAFQTVENSDNTPNGILWGYSKFSFRIMIGGGSSSYQSACRFMEAMEGTCCFGLGYDATYMNALKKLGILTNFGFNSFYGSQSLTEIESISFPHTFVGEGYYGSGLISAFNGCLSLRDASVFTGTYTETTAANMFYNCQNLDGSMTLDMPNVITLGNWSNMYSLKKLNFVRLKLYAGSGAVLNLSNCFSLDTQDCLNSIGKAIRYTYLVNYESTIKSTYPTFSAAAFSNLTYSQMDSLMSSSYPLYTAYNSILSGKNLIITGCPNASTITTAPWTNLQGTLIQ
jgi:hypothetical protein